MTARGIALVRGERQLRLKWHKLRRAAGLAAHDRESLEIGLARGALLEVDLRLTADDHWVCLHDATLDAETTGRGPVAAAPRRAIESLRQRDPSGAPLPTPPLFLDELTERLARHDTGARLQLDLKLDGRSIEGLARARFGAAVAPMADRFDIGAHDWQAVSDLASLAPGSRRGFDPLELLPDPEKPLLADRQAAETFAAAMLAAAPAATMLYLYHGLIRQAAALGVDLVGIAHAHGREVDCWTVDPPLDGLDELIGHLFAVGCDQLTTNAPEALETWWQRRGASCAGAPIH
jgi:glycerophosphoryl diester phosphodiesterase